MNKILDAFFWRDPYTGKRRPRLVFWGAALALVAVVVAAVATGLFVTHSPAALAPTPTFPPPTATPLPSPTFTPSPVPTATPVPVTEKDKLLAEIRGCEKDPARWTLTDQHQWKWKVLSEPKCALDGLSRAVAWYIAVRAMGYAADDEEVAGALGYPNGQIPLATSKTWWTYFATAGKRGYAPLVYHFYPGIRQWKVKSGRIGGITLTPRGCYYANHVEKGRVVSWSTYGFPFQIECYVYEDFTADHSVYQFGDVVGMEEEPKQYRFPLLFAYSPETGWVHLGRIKDKKFWHEPVNDVETVARNWGTEVWNVEWVTRTWGVQPRPLPSGWEQASYDDYDKAFQSNKPQIVQWFLQHATYSVKPPNR